MIRYNYSVSYASSDKFDTPGHRLHLCEDAVVCALLEIEKSTFLGRDGYNEVSQHFFPLLVSSKAYGNLQRYF